MNEQDMTGLPEAFTMRTPCLDCGGADGYVQERNGQDTVRCSRCHRFCYNAPRTETGRKQRTVTTVHNGIKPGQRARILERATGRCELCGGEGNLHVGHILSVDDGMLLFTKYAIPVTETDLNSDENLASLCAECNLGMGSRSFSPRLYVALLWRRCHVDA